MYRFGKRSRERLKGVKPELINGLNQLIKIMDVTIIEGVRSQERQDELVAKGASKTKYSKHIEGKAVDLMAYVNGRACWELNVYDAIADAMKQAAIQVGVPICWGAAWGTPEMPYPMDIRKWEGSMEEAMNAYIDLRRSQGRRPFMDGPHFELIG